jgi:nitrite reductase/ring-hydroxylating ferredoxin subunit
MDGAKTGSAALQPALANTHYTCPETYRAEHARIFYRSWLFLAHDSDLAQAGAYVAGHVADQAVFAIRGRDGDVRAFYNVCRHRGHRIVEGRGVAERVLVCPYHAWSYEQTGALRSARGAEKGQDRATLGLQPIRIERLGGLWLGRRRLFRRNSSQLRTLPVGFGSLKCLGLESRKYGYSRARLLWEALLTKRVAATMSPSV